jgi:hypothetical protein
VISRRSPDHCLLGNPVMRIAGEQWDLAGPLVGEQLDSPGGSERRELAGPARTVGRITEWGRGKQQNARPRPHQKPSARHLLSALVLSANVNARLLECINQLEIGFDICRDTN